MFGFISSIIVVAIFALGMFLSGLWGWAGKGTEVCIKKATNFAGYSTMYSIGPLQLNEPIWKQACKRSVPLDPSPSDSPAADTTPLAQ